MPIVDAHDLFVLFKKEGIKAIQQAVDEQWQEDLILDFKLADGNIAPMTVKTRQLLAEALSGFANSEGGLIVWGIYAASANATEPDVAKKREPISGLKRFLSDLQIYTAQLVSPAIIGVEHDIIEDPPKSDTGYAITYVPKGAGEPHMARAKDQHRFYYRSGCSFVPMEAFMLSDRYGRRPQPKLELAWRVMRTGGSGTAEHPISSTIVLILGIHNAGLGVALYPALALYEDDDCKLDKYGLDGNGHTGLPLRLSPFHPAEGRWRFHVGGVNDVVHPGTVLEVTRIRYEIPAGTAHLISQRVRYELHCQGFTRTDEVIIQVGNFLKMNAYSYHS